MDDHAWQRWFVGCCNRLSLPVLPGLLQFFAESSDEDSPKILDDNLFLRLVGSSGLGGQLGGIAQVVADSSCSYLVQPKLVGKFDVVEVFVGVGGVGRLVVRRRSPSGANFDFVQTLIEPNQHTKGMCSIMSRHTSRLL